MRFLSDKAGFLIGANLVKYAVGFAMPMVLVRMLSQSDYGTYQQLVLIGNFTVGVLTLGLPASIYYFYPNVTPERRPALIVQTSLMLGMAGMLAIAALIFGAQAIANVLNNPKLAELLAFYAFSAAFMLASEHCFAFLIAQNRYANAVVFELVETFVRVLILLTPLWLGFGIMGLVIGTVIYAALRFVLRSAYMFASADVRFSGWSRSLFAFDQLAYSIPIALGALVAIIGGVINRGLVAASFSPAEYAIYAVGTLEIPLDVIFQASVATVLRASLPPLIRDGNLAEVVRIVGEAVRKLSLVILPSFIFLFGYSHEFITVLFTSRYEESVHVFRIYLWLLPLYMFVFSLIPHSFGKTRVHLYVMLAMTSVLVVLSYALLKTIGFYGPAIAMVVSQYFGVILFLIVVLRLTRTTLSRLLPLSSMLRTVLASLVGLLAARVADHLTSFALLNLFFAGLIFSAIFLAIAVPFGIFTSSDRELFWRWIVKFLSIGSR